MVLTYFLASSSSPNLVLIQYLYLGIILDRTFESMATQAPQIVPEQVNMELTVTQVASDTIVSFLDPRSKSWTHMFVDARTSHCAIVDPGSNKINEKFSYYAVRENLTITHIFETMTSTGPSEAARKLHGRINEIQPHHPPQMCCESRISSLLKRQHCSRASEYENTYRGHMTDTRLVKVGSQDVALVPLPGILTYHRRAVHIGRCIFGGHAVASVAELSTPIEALPSWARLTYRQVQVQLWCSMRKMLGYPSDFYLFFDADSHCTSSSNCYETVQQCNTGNRYAHMTKDEFLETLGFQRASQQRHWIRSKLASWFRHFRR